MTQSVDKLVKITKTTLVEQVIERIQAFVLHQQLQPGDALPSELRLAETLGVSRPVIREALRMLAGRGFLTIANGRNAVISPVSATALVHFFQRATQLNAVTILEVLEVRRGIEKQSVELAALHRTDTDVEKLQQTLKDLREHRADLPMYSQLDAQLHVQIAVASQNSMLRYFVESFSGAFQHVSLMGLQNRRTQLELDQVHADHEEIVQAVILQHNERASLLMDQHVTSAILALRRTVA
ncbi:MAG: FadR family transcriptional regulator [Chloroflexi bacterium]|nr:FadR family transcriptional regulator [Chloroflexota bacterium]